MRAASWLGCRTDSLRQKAFIITVKWGSCFRVRYRIWGYERFVWLECFCDVETLTNMPAFRASLRPFRVGSQEVRFPRGRRKNTGVCPNSVAVLPLSAIFTKIHGALTPGHMNAAFVDAAGFGKFLANLGSHGLLAAEPFWFARRRHYTARYASRFSGRFRHAIPLDALRVSLCGSQLQNWRRSYECGWLTYE